jgi:hypothetical protein
VVLGIWPSSWASSTWFRRLWAKSTITPAGYLAIAVGVVWLIVAAVTGRSGHRDC